MGAAGEADTKGCQHAAGVAGAAGAANAGRAAGAATVAEVATVGGAADAARAAAAARAATATGAGSCLFFGTGGPDNATSLALRFFSTFSLDRHSPAPGATLTAS